MSKIYTADQVAAHNTTDDIWLIIRGNVYDVTKFLDEHPGGDEVLNDLAGKEATQEYEDVGHSDEADELMEQYLIGKLKEGSKPTKSVSKKSSTTGGDASAVSTYAVPVALIVGILLAAKFLGVI